MERGRQTGRVVTHTRTADDNAQVQNGGWLLFLLQLDGTLTDNPDPAKADMAYASLEELKRAVDVEEIFD